MPVEPIGDDEIGPVGDALRRAVAGAEPVRLVRHGGHRVTAADHFLSGLPDDRFQLRADADVASLVIDDGRAVGVVLSDGEKIDARRRRGVRRRHRHAGDPAALRDHRRRR